MTTQGKKRDKVTWRTVATYEVKIQVHRTMSHDAKEDVVVELDAAAIDDAIIAAACEAGLSGTLIRCVIT